ncbi:MAG: choice-of-anchor Q domain-containing protein [Acidimicrobiia bacterium]|nr:choice-of-anchor Q domain-containing protein [Acidimicrobiia bacterium]
MDQTAILDNEREGGMGQQIRLDHRTTVARTVIKAIDVRPSDEGVSVAASTIDGPVEGRIEAGASILHSSDPTCSVPGDSLGFNVVDDDSCGFDEPTDLVGASPLLHHPQRRQRRPDPDTDPGGQLPRDRSGPRRHAWPLPSGTFPTDQRGEPRPSAGGCDAGAVEGAGPAIHALDLTVDAAADGDGDAVPGDRRCDRG